MDKLCETINRQCCLHCEMECDGKWLETEIEMYKEDLLKKQSDKITDLEAKLAESENKIYELITKLNMKEYAPAFCSLAGRDCEALGKLDQLKQQLEERFTEKDVEGLIKDREETIKFLKQQLAEKDEEIAKYTNCKMIVVGGRSQGKKHFMEIKIKELQNQIAIDKLEKVIEFMKTRDEWGFFPEQMSIAEYINQQIINLKGEDK